MFIYFSSITVAHALYFAGGNGDGHANGLGNSRSWGFFGGTGRHESMILTASATLMTFTSAAAQQFTVGDLATAMSPLTIRQDTAVGTGVTTANGLRVVIPVDLDMVWDSSITTAVIGGAAAAKVSTTVSYADSDKTLVLAVSSNFSDGDEVTVSGLKFKTFAAVSDNPLWLDITGAGTVYDFDLLNKLILFGSRSNGFLGGSGRYDGLSIEVQNERPWGYLGGSGRNEVMGRTGSRTVMLFTSADSQSFTSGDLSTIASDLTITQEVGIGTGVVTAHGLQIIIPAQIGMSWDASKNWAALTVTGSASGKVSGITYPTNKTALIAVSSNFSDGDTITVSGLAFDSFIYPGIQPLWLDITGTGDYYESDPMMKLLLMAPRSTGYLGGSGGADVSGGIYLLPRNMVEMGTLF